MRFSVMLNLDLTISVVALLGILTVFACVVFLTLSSICIIWFNCYLLVCFVLEFLFLYVGVFFWSPGIVLDML
jgi:hypothetical protein